MHDRQITYAFGFCFIINLHVDISALTEYNLHFEIQFFLLKCDNRCQHRCFTPFEQIITNRAVSALFYFFALFRFLHYYEKFRLAVVCLFSSRSDIFVFISDFVFVAKISIGQIRDMFIFVR